MDLRVGCGAPLKKKGPLLRTSETKINLFKEEI